MKPRSRDIGFRPTRRGSRRAGALLGCLVLFGGLLAACGGSEVRREATVKRIAPDTLAAWMRSGQPLVLFDTRDRDAFERRHVPGAMAAETRRVGQLRDVLPRDPDTPIVVYNEDGTMDPAGDDLATEAAETFHFSRVYWLEGGLEAWAAAGFNLDGRQVLER